MAYCPNCGRTDVDYLHLETTAGCSDMNGIFEVDRPKNIVATKTIDLKSITKKRKPYIPQSERTDDDKRGCESCEHSFFLPETVEWECNVNERGIRAYMGAPAVNCINWVRDNREDMISIPQQKESTNE